MRNVKLTLQYDGTDFSGFEVQPGRRTVRQELEKALKKVYKKPVKFHAASRTDAGVHALGNVISFKAPASIPLSKLPIALNGVLPEDIRVVKAEAREFNARFDARAKTYEYLVFNERIMPPHLRRFAWQVKPKLDLSAMRRASKFMVGKHDFSSFCASGGDDTNFVRIIHQLVISHLSREKSRDLSLVIWKGKRFPLISIRVTGNGFLYKMVRNLVGTLVEVGLGRKKPDDVRRIFNARDRRLAGRTAPAHGLCLIEVCYN